MKRKTIALHTERGQSLVEFAFGVIIALILLAGVVDLGRAFFSYMAISDAAQEGAAYASICPIDDNAIVARTRNTSQSPVPMSDASTVDVECFYLFDNNGDGDMDDPGEAIAGCNGTPAPSSGEPIKVRVTLRDFTITMPFLGGFLGSQTFDFEAEATDTILRETCP